MDRAFWGTAASVAVLELLAACGSNSTPDPNPSPDPNLTSPAGIYGYLEGKTFVQTGADIPPYPNGLNENVNNDGSPAGGACDNAFTLQFASTSGSWTVNGELGTLVGAPNIGDVGVCDKNMISGPVGPFTSSFVVANIIGDASCFDIDMGSPLTAVGRASISQDAKTLSWEIYEVTLGASSARCADGPVGASGVTLMGSAFTGNAVQVWRLQ
jgi:hypothetical protein